MRCKTKWNALRLALETELQHLREADRNTTSNIKSSSGKRLKGHEIDIVQETLEKVVAGMDQLDGEVKS